jgi:hypothetical protein
MHAQDRRPSFSLRLSPPVLPEDDDVLDAARSELLAAAVLPVQFFRPPDRSDTAPGTIALMRAVLEDALQCVANQYSHCGRRPQRLAREAEAWVFAEDEHWPFAFVNICAVLGLDPGYVRRGLLCWRRQRRTASRMSRPHAPPLRTTA